MLNISGPKEKIKISLRISGSKSISNRLLMIKEVLDVSTEYTNLSDSEDTLLLLKALKTLNTPVENTINIGHAGTDMRFLTALLATKKGNWMLTGSERMKQRPIAELVDALKTLGADIKYSEQYGFPPLRINGGSLKGGKLSINAGVSSQFISALLLVSPLFEHGLELHLKGEVVSRPYIDMTISLLREFGLVIDVISNIIRVHPLKNTHVAPATINIESDWSSASYWYGICALSPGSEIELSYLNEQSLQADSLLPILFKPLGVSTRFKDQTVFLSQTAIAVSDFEYDFTSCPDIAQTLATTCVGLGVTAKLTGLSTLKLKETDRIVALKNELEKFGAIVHASPNSLQIEALKDDQKNKNETISIHTYNDHRMAMSFAPLSLRFGSLLIENPAVIDKSYPAYWEDLKSAGFSVNLQP